MGRPVGSVNKPKEEAVTPPIVPRRTICKHAKDMHYGGPHGDRGGWCHEVGCDCQLYANCDKK